MPTHNSLPEHENDRQPGYETSDANFGGIVTFVIVLASSLAVFFVVCFGMGKLINEALIRHDGPLNTWSQEAGVQRSNMASNPAIEQQQLQDLTSKFPTPRLQTDDGNLDVAQLHAREDILLDHYSWIDPKAQTVRIPITRAMQILAQQGLPVVEQPIAKPGTTQPVTQAAMVGDADTSIALPLTDGFARTGPELKMIEEHQQRMGLEAESGHAQAQ